MGHHVALVADLQSPADSRSGRDTGGHEAGEDSTGEGGAGLGVYRDVGDGRARKVGLSGGYGSDSRPVVPLHGGPLCKVVSEGFGAP